MSIIFAVIAIVAIIAAVSGSRKEASLPKVEAPQQPQVNLGEIFGRAASDSRINSIQLPDGAIGNLGGGRGRGTEAPQIRV